ncbi:protein phosphatase 2C domain-containing protein [Candidatus Micrarchaeota archaeon]|nr:protein phosphatase 2C domain-containing protein [Candidatus Micrarchaeota archaeon]
MTAIFEKISSGIEIQESQFESGGSSFCTFSTFVKSGHTTCGDSAFVYYDSKKAIFGVFDGVSADPDGAIASACAARFFLDELKHIDRINERSLESSFHSVHSKIEKGNTTAVILIIQNNGSFVIGSVGDSVAYGINKEGKIELELPIARAVGDGDSVFKYFQFRNILTSVLGPISGLQKDPHELHIRKGKLQKNELFILASDGLSDNLFLRLKDGYIVDSSGSADLAELIGTQRDPEKITKIISSSVSARLSTGRVEKSNLLLVPKQDDVSIVVVKMLG